jgi:hypothetical protein
MNAENGADIVNISFVVGEDASVSQAVVRAKGVLCWLPFAE